MSSAAGAAPKQAGSETLGISALLLSLDTFCTEAALRFWEMLLYLRNARRRRCPPEVPVPLWCSVTSIYDRYPRQIFEKF